MLKGTVIRVKDLKDGQIKRMYSIMNKYFDNIIESNFYNDLSKKEDAILLRDENEVIRGFTSLAIFPHDERAQLIFSGDTIIEKEYWGSSDLQPVWLKNALARAGEFDGKTYWLLLSKGYKTYRFLPTFFKNYYPRAGTAAPAEIQEIIDGFARRQFGSKYQNGVWAAGKDFLKKDFAKISAARLKNKNIAFFLEKNPGYKNGDELVCITELSVGNLSRAGVRILGK